VLTRFQKGFDDAWNAFVSDVAGDGDVHGRL
jgi:hypothetical protein